MSLVFALVPLALAAVASQLREEESSESAGTIANTRLRDPLLLERSLGVLGCSTSRTELGIRAERDGLSVEFIPGDATSGAEARFPQGTDPAAAASFLSDVDHEFCRLVQDQVYERVVSNAGSMGLNLMSEEVGSDGSITLTLETGS